MNFRIIFPILLICVFSKINALDDKGLLEVTFKMAAYEFRRAENLAKQLANCEYLSQPIPLAKPAVIYSFPTSSTSNSEHGSPLETSNTTSTDPLSKPIDDNSEVFEITPR